MDAARDFLARQHQQTQSGAPSGRGDRIVLVRSNSGADRQRSDVLGISGPVFDPASDEDAITNYRAMTGIATLLPVAALRPQLPRPAPQKPFARAAPAQYLGCPNLPGNLRRNGNPRCPSTKRPLLASRSQRSCWPAWPPPSSRAAPPT